jgi:hypothetical protein
MGTTKTNPSENPRVPRKIGRSRKKKTPSSRPVSGRNECLSANRILVRNLAPSDKRGQAFVPYKVQDRPKSNGLVRFKQSLAWMQFSRSKKALRAVPFIDHRGFIHSVAVCYWKCTSPQLFATILSTVYKRLHAGERKVIFKYRVKPKLLFEIALLYTITLDSYWLTRTMELLKRRNLAVLVKHIYWKKNNVGSNKRFLFDQASLNALWLQSRVFAPRVTPTPNALILKYQARVPLNVAPLWSVTSCLNRFMYDWACAFSPGPTDNILGSLNSLVQTSKSSVIF